MMTYARTQFAADRTADYETVTKAYEDVQALTHGESTRQLVEDRIAICSAYVDRLSLSSELEPQIMQRVEVQRKTSFNETTAKADLLDHHRLEHHDLALGSADHGDSTAVTLFVRHLQRNIT